MSSTQFDPSQALAGLTGGGGAAPDPAAGASPDPNAGGSVGPSTTSAPTGDVTDILRQVIDLLDQYLQEEQDDTDLAAARKLQATVQDLLAKDQKDMEAAQGVTPVHRGMRKAMQRAQAGGGGAQGGGGGNGY